MMEAKEEVKKTIHLFFKAMDTQNMDLMCSVLPESTSMIHIGTDVDEIWRGHTNLIKATEEQFQNLEYYKATIHGLTINLSSNKQTAWYFHLLDAEIKSDENIQHWENARFTGMLEKQDDHWLLMQTHVSLPGEL